MRKVGGATPSLTCRQPPAFWRRPASRGHCFLWLHQTGGLCHKASDWRGNCYWPFNSCYDLFFYFFITFSQVWLSSQCPTRSMTHPCCADPRTSPSDLYSRATVCSMGRGLINISLWPMLTGNSSLMGNKCNLQSLSEIGFSRLPTLSALLSSSIEKIEKHHNLCQKSITHQDAL